MIEVGWLPTKLRR